MSEEIEKPGIGHNSGNPEPFKEPETKDVEGVGGQRLKAFIERIERLEAEKSAMQEDIKEIYSEAKGTGFDAKTIRKIVALRKMDAEKRRESDDLLDIYRNAIGLV